MQLIYGERVGRFKRMAKACCRKTRFSPYRGWEVWCVDGIALLFKRGRCLRMYWDEYRQLNPL